MKKTIILILILLIGGRHALGRGAYSPSGTVEGVNKGQVLLTSQIGWNILDETSSAGDEPTDLAVTERTYATVVAAIAAASSGDDKISIAHLPASWNGIRFRVIGVAENGTATYQIYLGSRAGGADTELAYAGQLAFTIGTQSSIYSIVAFTSGGTRTIVQSDTVTGNTSAETATVLSVELTSGTFAAGDAAGNLTVTSQSGTFQSETLNITDVTTGIVFTNNATIGSDMSRFEMADTLATITTSDWTSTWTSTSPTGDRIAEAKLDLNGADTLIMVPTTITTNSKLLAKGF